MKSRLDQYLEAAKMSPEDMREIDRLSAVIFELRRYGDDQHMDEIREARQEIKRIKSKYLLPEEKLQAIESNRKRSIRGWEQRRKI